MEIGRELEEKIHITKNETERQGVIIPKLMKPWPYNITQDKTFSSALHNECIQQESYSICLFYMFPLSPTTVLLNLTDREQEVKG